MLPAISAKDAPAIKPSATTVHPAPTNGDSKGTQDGDTQTVHPCQALSHCSHPQRYPRGLRMGRFRILAQMAEVPIKAVISVSLGSCIFLY